MELVGKAEILGELDHRAPHCVFDLDAVLQSELRMSAGALTRHQDFVDARSTLARLQVGDHLVHAVIERLKRLELFDWEKLESICVHRYVSTGAFGSVAIPGKHA